MGCDIHIAVEVKTPDGWRYRKTFPYYDEPDFSFSTDPCSRDYRLFAVLGDVRNIFMGFVAPFAARGLPADGDKVAGFEDGGVHWESPWDPCDMHSRTWMTIGELATLDIEAMWPPTDPFMAWLEGPIDRLVKQYGAAGVRLVLAWDN